MVIGTISGVWRYTNPFYLYLYMSRDKIMTYLLALVYNCQDYFLVLIVLDGYIQRGNLNTRLSKLDAGDKYDALILAAAGMERMGWAERIDQVIKFSNS